jgi:probable phosphoglycerate mutase
MSIAGPILMFARHGRTAWNAAGRYQGRSDPPISGDGVADAEDLARALRDRKPASIVASPARRAMMTAEIVAARLGVPCVQVDGRLVEIAYGAWEGLTQVEVKARWPDQLRLWKRSPGTMRFPGGESLEEARERLLAFVAGSPVLKSARGPVLAVGHGGLIRLAMLEATGSPLADYRGVLVGHGSVHRFSTRRDSSAGHLVLRETESLTCGLL